jgi:sec-independent protein translocase protein TatA
VTGITSPWHLLLLAFAIVFFFGAKRLPEIGRSLGQGMREFKQSVTGEHTEQTEPPTTTSTATATQPALPAALQTSQNPTPPLASQPDRDTIG